MTSPVIPLLTKMEEKPSQKKLRITPHCSGLDCCGPARGGLAGLAGSLGDVLLYVGRKNLTAGQYCAINTYLWPGAGLD